MLRKTLCTLVVALCLGAVEARAMEDLLPSDIMVTQRCGEYLVAGGAVELCRAGDLSERGFLLGEEFGGGYIAPEDVMSPEFAFWMAQKAAVGQVRPVNSMGIVRFPSMDPGLYLVRQREPAPG